MHRRVCRPRASRRSPDTISFPPYVGPRGWLGINLDRGIAWRRVVAHARDAWLKVAPAKLAARLDATDIDVKPPTSQKLKPAEIDPLQSARGRRLLAALRRACGELPMSPKIRNSATRSGVRARRYSRGPGITTTGSRPVLGRRAGAGAHAARSALSVAALLRSLRLDRRWMPASASTRPSYVPWRLRATGISQRSACSRVSEHDVASRQCP
jgi:hypothetical protein